MVIAKEMTSPDNTSGGLFQILGSTTTEDATASLSLSSSNPPTVEPVHRALPAVRARPGSAPDGRDRREYSPRGRGSGVAGTARRALALEDLPGQTHRKRRQESESDDEQPPAVQQRTVAPISAPPLGDNEPGQSSGERPVALAPAPDSGERAAVREVIVIPRGPLATRGALRLDSPRVSPYPAASGSPPVPLPDRAANFAQQQASYRAQRQRVAAVSQPPSNASDFASADEGVVELTPLGVAFRAAASEVLERQSADGQEIALLTVRAASAAASAKEAVDREKKTTERAEQGFKTITVNVTAALAAAGDKYAVLESEARTVTQSLNARIEHEMIIARTWEHACHEEEQTTQKIRTQACDVVDEMQESQKLQIGAIYEEVSADRKAARKSEKEAKHLGDEARHASAQIHQQLRNCEASYGERLNDATLAAQLRVTAAEDKLRARTFPEPAETASLKEEVRRLRAELEEANRTKGDGHSEGFVTLQAELGSSRAAEANEKGMRDQAERKCLHLGELMQEKTREAEDIRKSLSASAVNEKITIERLVTVNASWEDRVSRLEIKASEASSRSEILSAKLLTEEALASFAGPQASEETTELLDKIDKRWRAELTEERLLSSAAIAASEEAQTDCIELQGEITELQSELHVVLTSAVTSAAALNCSAANEPQNKTEPVRETVPKPTAAKELQLGAATTCAGPIVPPTKITPASLLAVQTVRPDGGLSDGQYMLRKYLSTLENPERSAVYASLGAQPLTGLAPSHTATFGLPETVSPTTAMDNNGLLISSASPACTQPVTSGAVATEVQTTKECGSKELKKLLKKAKRKEKKKRKANRRAAGETVSSTTSSASSEKSVAAATTKTKRPGKGKVSDKVKIFGSFPTHLNLVQWNSHVMNACFQAGGHTDHKEFPWLQSVLQVKEDHMRELVQVPEEFAEIDKLLAFAFRKQNWMPQELMREVIKIESELMQQVPIVGTVTGQMLWWMIHQYLKAMPGLGYLCNTIHLYKISWMGDSANQIKQFIGAWEYVLANMDPKEIPSEQSLTEIFLDRFKHAKLPRLKWDYEYFCRLDLGHTDRTYKYLLFCLNKLLRDLQADRNKNDIIHAHDKFALGYNPGIDGFAEKAAPAFGGPQGPDQFTSNCYNCGKPGHFAKECPEPKKGKGKGGGKSPGGKNRPASQPPGKGGGKNREYVDPLGRSKEQLARMHCYYHHHGGCRHGDKCFYKHNDNLPKTAIDKLTPPPLKDGTIPTPRAAPARAGSEPPKKTKTNKKADPKAVPAPKAKGSGRKGDRTDSPAPRGGRTSSAGSKSSAKSGTTAASTTTKLIKAKHRVRLCPEHMKSITQGLSSACTRTVAEGKCSRGLHCTEAQATKKKAAAKAAAQTEIAALHKAEGRG